MYEQNLQNVHLVFCLEPSKSSKTTKKPQKTNKQTKSRHSWISSFLDHLVGWGIAFAVSAVAWGGSVSTRHSTIAIDHEVFFFSFFFLGKIVDFFPFFFLGNFVEKEFFECPCHIKLKGSGIPVFIVSNICGKLSR